MTKSLEELEMLADEQLSKAEKLTANEIAEDSVESQDEAENKAEKAAEETEVKKSEKFQKDKDGDDPAKPDMATHRDEEDQDAEDIEKCDDPEKMEKSENLTEKNEDLEDEAVNGDRTDKAPTSKINEPKEKKEALQKSYETEFKNHPDLAGKEMTYFMDAVVDVLSKSLADMHYELMASAGGDTPSGEVLAKSAKAQLLLQKSVTGKLDDLETEQALLRKSMKKGFADIMEAIEELDTKPATIRKSAGSISVLEKDFSRSIDGKPATKTLSKSQILDSMTAEMLNGNPNITVGDIVNFESGSPLRPGIMELIGGK